MWLRGDIVGRSEMLVTLWVQKVDFWKQRERDNIRINFQLKKKILGGNLIFIYESLFSFGNELYMKAEALTEMDVHYLNAFELPGTN